jgi:hypothetical protein
MCKSKEVVENYNYDTLCVFSTEKCESCKKNNVKFIYFKDEKIKKVCTSCLKKSSLD